MTYMTFKIKKDWLFYTLFSVSCVCNLLLLLLFILGVSNDVSDLLVFSGLTGLFLTALNGYFVFCLIKSYNVGLTMDSIKISDLTTVEIPYETIKSIKKDRTPSKYRLYEALLVIKYNEYDTIKINVDDLENVFDNLKEMVQKANLDKVVNNIVTRKDGSKEIQQNIPTAAASESMGTTVVIPAAATPTGTVVIKPEATSAKVISAPIATTPVVEGATEVKPASQPVVATAPKPVVATAPKPVATKTTTKTTTTKPVGTTTAAKPAATKTVTTTKE